MILRGPIKKCPKRVTMLHASLMPIIFKERSLEDGFMEMFNHEAISGSTRIIVESHTSSEQ